MGKQNHEASDSGCETPLKAGIDPWFEQTNTKYREDCPKCKKRIGQGAHICKHCAKIIHCWYCKRMWSGGRFCKTCGEEPDDERLAKIQKRIRKQKDKRTSSTKRKNSTASGRYKKKQKLKENVPPATLRRSTRKKWAPGTKPVLVSLPSMTIKTPRPPRPPRLETMIQIAPAKSDRSRCQNCRDYIQQGATRVGIEAFIAGGMRMTYQHPKCFHKGFYIDLSYVGRAKCRFSGEQFGKPENRFGIRCTKSQSAYIKFVNAKRALKAYLQLVEEIDPRKFKKYKKLSEEEKTLLDAAFKK